MIVKLDHDSFFTAGQHRAQTEFLVLYLGTLGKNTGSHNAPKVVSLLTMPGLEVVEGMERPEKLHT
jgi:hypothetical protein